MTRISPASGLYLQEMEQLKPGKGSRIVSKTLYGLLFTVFLPGLLVWWCGRLNLGLPAYHLPLAGAALVGGGLTLMAAGSLALWKRGKGLPMNAFPPVNLVTNGVYGLFPHPIYLGFIITVAGTSLIAGSGEGLWLATPLSALACLAIVLGYEKPYLLKTFGRSANPLLGPPPLDCPLTFARRLGAMLAVCLPWLLSYYAFKALGAPRDALVANFSFESSWPVMPQVYPIYASAYFVVPLSFFAVKKAATLRRYFFAAWLAMGFTSLFYLAFPLIAPTRPFEVNSLWSALLAVDIAKDYPPVCACPSYHVIWALLAAYFYSLERSLFLRSLAWLWAASLAMSCLATSFHALIDVLGGAIAAIAVINSNSIWRKVIEGGEKLANSWRCRLFFKGRVRVINHSFYAGVAAGLGFLCAAVLSGGLVGWLMLLGIMGTLSAGLWGQWLEGSGRLQRPFGFFGGIFGLVLGFRVAGLLGGEGWLLAASVLTPAPLVQAIGRLRCLVQGCCHGRPVDGGGQGLRVSNAHSRVSAVSGLAGRPVHATQVYSIAANLLIAVLLWRAWLLGAPLSFICGLYFILSGLARFMEEAWRGEVQTVMKYGLSVYQWLALLMAVAGFFFSAQSSNPAPLISLEVSPAGWLGSVIFGLLCALAMGVDLPRSSRRFARLSG